MSSSSDWHVVGKPDVTVVRVWRSGAGTLCELERYGTYRVLDGGHLATRGGKPTGWRIERDA